MKIKNPFEKKIKTEEKISESPKSAVSAELPQESAEHLLTEINQVRAHRSWESLSVPELEQIKHKYTELGRMLGVELPLVEHDAPKEIHEVSLEEARELFTNNFYGPEAIKQAFGIEIDESEIPQIPYTQETLEHAQKRGEFLILRISHDSDGHPLTMQRITEIMEHHMDAEKEGKLLYSVDWYAQEPFYTDTAIKTEWKLVQSAVVPDVTSEKDEHGNYTKDTRNHNYIHQTRLLREYLISTNTLSTKDAETCSDEILKVLSDEMGVDWDTQKITNNDIYTAHWQEVAHKLSALPINQTHRRIPAEIIYDWVMQFKQSKERGILEYNYDWSSALSSDGDLVRVGFAGALGAYVVGGGPVHRLGVLGVVSQQ